MPGGEQNVFKINYIITTLKSLKQFNIPYFFVFELNTEIRS